ncbi:uncharacterized protein LACBIDRAFT_314995 [Laccaria bicolor S238N-H82]|uniref:Predicted protein n=1 Tax=Laccaria bicolor (strain S238N-H82 / ATCC MYA-4686) TaxID=486041 RepID=B0DZJ0_LACBS|nr:uncharacterized protein LACBIDRAFT_314995 [Laccaria bicolor S238N-H82]EDQ99948.1 predicted protein [Laccaria bicolor S238N-H82]|eukprot:XP_001889359.1 predicted protein [Laccaria bicolor S238N-H82]
MVFWWTAWLSKEKRARYPATAPGATVSGRHVPTPSRILMSARVVHKRQVTVAILGGLPYAPIKKDYQAVHTLWGLSGFGWDDTAQIVTAPDSVWEDLLKTCPKLKKWRKTPFPLYDTVHSLIYGTFATGNGAFHAGHNHTPTPPASPHSNVDSHKEDESFIDPILQSSQDIKATQAQSSQGSTICSSNLGEESFPLSVTPLTPLPSNGCKHSADDTFEE